MRRFGWGPFETFVFGAGVFATLVCVVIVAVDGNQQIVQQHEVLLSFLTVAAVGELFRIHMPTGRIFAPVASSAAVALAFLGVVSEQPDVRPRAGVIVIVVSTGMVLGVLMRRLMRMPADVYTVAARILGVAIVAGLWRQVRWDGLSLALWQRSSGAPGWQIAVAMLVVGGCGILFELVLTGLVRAERQRAHPWASLRDEFTEAKPLTLSLVTTGPLIALTAPVLGILALPLAMVPIIITYVAVRRFAAIRTTYRQTIAVLSRLTEAGGYTPSDHGERVAALATRMGRTLGLLERELRDLEYAALLHDLGQLGLRTPIPDGATVMAAPDDQTAIAANGATILRHVTVLGQVADIVERQSTPYRLVREMGRPVPIAARILKVANAFDDLSAGQASAASREAALERIQLGLGYEYDPEVVEALIKVLAAPASSEPARAAEAAR